MDGKIIANETLTIMRQGYYECEGRRIDIKTDMEKSISHSILFTPKQGEDILKKYEKTSVPAAERLKFSEVENISTVDAIRKMTQEGRKEIGVLNFASAKNPGGGFINGAMAQEESLAASSTLYRTLLAHEEYYKSNRAQNSMMYTDYGIYSPDVVFFRDGRFTLTDTPVKASVLTLPAVNMGQVLQKGEDIRLAQKVMRRRMKLALAVFAEQGAKNLILGAYGCGVFRNDPAAVAVWWKEILEEGMEKYFESVFYAVLDRSRGGNCFGAFQKVFGGSSSTI